MPQVAHANPTYTPMGMLKFKTAPRYAGRF